MSPLLVNQLSPAKNRYGERIRVLLLTDEMEVGGTQRQIVHLASGLDRASYEVQVAYFCNRSFLADELIAAGIPVIEIAKKRRIDVSFIRALVKFLREERFDIIHCFAFSAELWGAVARRFLPAFTRPTLITSVRGKYDWYTSLQWRVKRWTALESTRVVANSQAGGNYAREKMRLPEGAIDVVYNGVALLSAIPKIETTTATILPDVELPAKSVTAIYVGRLVSVKNVSVLLRAMKNLRSIGTSIRLLIVGDGPLRQSLHDEIMRLNLDDCVALLGQRSDAQALMAAADFLVLPSFWEGLSNVILESMMVGTPVIASAVGGSVELIENRCTGLLFASDNDTELAAAMSSLIADHNLGKRLGFAGQQRVIEQFSIAAMIRNMQDLYAQTAAKHRLPNSFENHLEKVSEV